MFFFSSLGCIFYHKKSIPWITVEIPILTLFSVLLKLIVGSLVEVNVCLFVCLIINTYLRNGKAIEMLRKGSDRLLEEWNFISAYRKWSKERVILTHIFGHNVIYSIIVANPQFPLKLLLLLTKISATFHNESFVLIKEVLLKERILLEEKMIFISANKRTNFWKQCCTISCFTCNKQNVLEAENQKWRSR